MGYIYRPKLKCSGSRLPESPAGCRDSRHGREDTCPACGARFSKTWWAKYYANGAPTRESTGTEHEAEARRFLKAREGQVATGEQVSPRVDRIRYEEAAEDLRAHYQTTGERDLVEAEWRLTHLDAFFRTKRLGSIGPADATRYIAKRQAEGAANGTINRELAVLGRMLRLAYENGKLLRLPDPPQAEGESTARGLLRAEPVRGGEAAPPPGSPGGGQHRLRLRLADAERGAHAQAEPGGPQRLHLRLEPGTTKNDDGRLVYLTPELVEMLQAQDERVLCWR